jgi:hypothetical protein
MDTIHFTYNFDFDDHNSQIHQIVLDSSTLSQKDRSPSSDASWTQLEFKQCNNCTLDATQHKHCPLALSLEPLLEKINDITSFDQTSVTVQMNERTISGELSAQDGFSSLIGILTATSDCPHTRFFKPMARFHLPFANAEETVFRAASTYMLAQYYRYKDGNNADMEMEGLYKIYSNIAVVNQAIANRIRSQFKGDSAVNAVIILDMFAKSISYTLDDMLEDFAPLFHEYTRNID